MKTIKMSVERYEAKLAIEYELGRIAHMEEMSKTFKNLAGGAFEDGDDELAKNYRLQSKNYADMAKSHRGEWEKRREQADAME